jgi:methylisocitrate lyase
MTVAKTTRLKRLINDPKLLIMPGAYDPISARVAEAAGFAAIQCSGFAISGTHLGRPDYSFLSMHEMVERSKHIARAVDIPVMADGDTGFGNAVNAYYTVQEFERAGAAGLNLEDQVMPKRCGHLDGKQILPFDEAVMKVRAAAEARIDADFVINARTDALAIAGMEEVIRRGNAFLEAGATMIFVDGVTSRTDIKAAVEGVNGPVAINIVEGGKSPIDIKFTELEALGVARVSLPVTLFNSAIRGMQLALESLKKNDAVSSPGDLLVDFSEATALTGMNEVLTLEKKYLAPLRKG